MLLKTRYPPLFSPFDNRVIAGALLLAGQRGNHRGWGLRPGSNGNDRGAGIDTSDPTQWGIVILVLLITVLIVWLASRSGAERGASEQAQERQAAQEQAAQAQEQTDQTGMGDVPPGRRRHCGFRYQRRGCDRRSSRPRQPGEELWMGRSWCWDVLAMGAPFRYTR